MDNKLRVLEYLQAGNTLTAFDGFTKFKIVSVRDYVSMLRLKDGIDIRSEWRVSAEGKRYKAYWISRETQQVFAKELF
jgi:hypothetical protein